MNLRSLMAGLGLLLNAWTTVAEPGLPAASEFRGEIRRDANGQLVTVPFAAAETSATTDIKSENRTESKPEPVPRLEPRTLRVGAGERYATLAAAASAARDGDTVEIVGGEYRGNNATAVWTQRELTLRGIGKRPRLIADGASAEGKAIWVVRGGHIRIENLEFSGARVPDQNGAGIRFEKGQLSISGCRFTDNEDGILTAGGPDMTLEIVNSEFDHNGVSSGRSHNLYVGEIRLLKVSGSYFHHARIGHLLKSRAAENHIRYNRLTDETGGTASYELEFPSGGIAYVVGNIIEQSPTTDNPNIISFGAEGYHWPNNELYIVSNTVIDDRPFSGNVLAVKPGAQKVLAMNNLLASKNGFSRDTLGIDAVLSNNFTVDKTVFVNAPGYDYRLKADARLPGKYAAPPTVHEINLAPLREYVHPVSTRPLGTSPTALGALQSPAGAR